MSKVLDGIKAAISAAESSDRMAAVEAVEKIMLTTSFVRMDVEHRCSVFEQLGPFWARCFPSDVLEYVSRLSSVATADRFTDAADALAAHRQPGLAAAFYDIAASMDGDPKTLLDAVRAWRAADAYGMAIEALDRAPVAANHFALARIHAELSLLDRDVLKAAQLVAALSPTEPRQVRATQHLAAAVARAQAIEGSPFAAADNLRGWHMAMTGGVLLRLAGQRHGDGAFRGRFGRHEDGPPAALEAVRKVAYILGVFDIPVSDVFFQANWPSAVLGHAIGKVFGKMPKPLTFPCEAPGLIVVNDLERLGDEEREQLAERRPGQLLWNHTSRHTADHPVAGDFTTVLCAENVSPWEVGPDGSPPLNADSPFALAEGVSTATLYNNALSDVPKLINLCRRVADGSSGAGPGFMLSEGHRAPQTRASPVSRRAGR